MKLLKLSCSVCANHPALAFEQWWNRDAGYGICGTCAQAILTGKLGQGMTPGDFKDCYGEEGKHWIALDHKFPDVTQPGAFYWVESTDPEGILGGPACWMVVIGNADGDGTEGFDDWFADRLVALEIAFRLSQGEDLSQ